MTLKEFSGCFVIQRDIDSLNEKIEEVRSLAEKTTTTFSPTGGSRSGLRSDKVGNYGDILIELRKELEAQKEKKVAEQLRLTKFFNSIDDPKIGPALRLKYCDMLTWRQVCGKLGLDCSEDSLRIACQRYLEKF